MPIEQTAGGARTRPTRRTVPTGRTARRRGTVLIVSMWIVLVIAGLVLVFARTVRVEAIASANQVAALQAEAAARGALQFVLAEVDGAADSSSDSTEADFEGILVGESPFWVLRTNLQDDGAHYFGLTDEAARVNLNSATLDMLLRLPDMTAELAASIVDWRDEDDEVSAGGAENEYYLLLSEPYYCKNSAFETVEEVLLVNGASPELLYGEDWNMNGVLDPNEDDGSDSEPTDDADGNLDHGFFDYVTVFSSQPNTSASGEERVNVNEVGSQGLSSLLREALSDDRYYTVMQYVRARRPFANVLDFYDRTNLTEAEFAPIADRITTSDEDVLVGLVNVNTAPREVLMCLPELDESDVDALLAGRLASEADLSTVAWVAEVLPREKAVAIGGQITTRSFQFSADILAASGDGRAYKRFRAVVDASESPPRVLSWCELTHLGWPLESEIIAALRSGSELSQVSLATGGA